MTELKQSRRQHTLPESASLILDIVRFMAALLVVACHVTQPEFHLGYRTNNALGVVAVSIFFVLSGFVIRFVTLTRESDVRVYFVDRASRIYSVVLPALALTLAVSGLCVLLNPPQFAAEWAPLFRYPGLRLFLNLIFLSQAWGHNTIPFMNLPFWSLGYEVYFYVLYGFFFFFGGLRRILLCVVTGLIVGPQVLFLLPVWALGCALYDSFQCIRYTRLARALLVVPGAWLTVALALYLVGHRALLLSPLLLLERFSHLTNPLLLVHLAPERATLFAFGTGIVATVVLFFVLLACQHVHLSPNNRWLKRVRTVADGTFTIYLMHYPLLALLVFAGLLRPHHTGTNLVVLTLLCLVLIAVAKPIDAFKRFLRRWLQARFSWQPHKTVRP